MFFKFQINMLLTFSTGDDCPCPGDIQEELYDFHNKLQLHCGKIQIRSNFELLAYYTKDMNVFLACCSNLKLL